VTEPRVFTIEEANRLLPRLRVLVAQQLERAATIARARDEARAAIRAGHPSDEDASALADLFAEYEAGWREIEAIGVVVKDPRIGLLDFYGKVDGKFVWLCWKYGEETVAHYHELDAGFAGRKRLEGAPARALLN